MERVIIFLSRSSFSDARTSLLCFQVILLKRAIELNFEFVTLSRFFEKIYYTFAEEPDKLFWTRLKEKSFAIVGNKIVGKCLKNLESRAILCIHRSKNSVSSVGPGFKTLRDWIRCLYNNVIDRLFVATSQSMIDRRQQVFSFVTNQLALI